MRTPIAFVDANVLFSKTLCDWLFLLRDETQGGLFRLFSSEDSITETMYHLRRKSPTGDGSVTARRNALVREYLDDIIAEFSGEVDFPGADKNDHHVHAAALAAQARYLISDDGGFADIDPDDLPYEVHTVDSFLMLVAENVPSAVDAVIARQRVYFEKRKNAKPLADALRDAGCPLFAECVRRHMQLSIQGKSTLGVAADVRREAEARAGQVTHPQVATLESADADAAESADLR